MSPLTAGLAILGALVVVAVLWRLLRRRPPPPHIQEAVCPSCGWKGQVSRYAGRCPRCNADMGEGRARHRGGD